MLIIDRELYLNRALISIAKSYVGVTENGSNNAGEFVRLFQRSVPNTAHGSPWCLHFVHHCIDMATRLINEIFDDDNEIESKVHRTGSTMLCFSKTDKTQQIFKPEPGALIFWQKYILDKPSDYGHVGIVLSVLDEQTILTIEGNTGQGDQRDGEGVCIKTRFYHHKIGDLVFKGFLRVW